MKKEQEGNNYIMLTAPDDPASMEYAAYGEKKFKSDEEAIKAFQGQYNINGGDKVARIIATAQSKLVKLNDA